MRSRVGRIGLRVGVVGVIALGLAGAGWGHEGHAHGEESGAAVVTGVADGAREGRVEIVVRDGFRFITSNGLPDHPTGAFPNRGNPNTIRPQEYRYRVTTEPRTNDEPTPARGPFGVAVNGVPLDPGTAEFWRGDRASGWRYEALSGKIDLGVDRNLAHVQPSGAYHYHGIPAGLVERLAPRGDAKRRMLLLGYAADGFPIYGPLAHDDANDARSRLRAMTSSYRLKSGKRPGGDAGPGGPYDGTFVQDYEYAPGAGDLDECNGRRGVTPEYPDGTYYYVLTEDFPFIPRLWRGTPDPSFERREGRPPPPGGRGPRRG